MECTNPSDLSLKPIFHNIRNMRHLTKDQLHQISTASDKDKMNIIEIFNEMLHWVVENVVGNENDHS
jgi:hypothetical protein